MHHNVIIVNVSTCGGPRGLYRYHTHAIQTENTMHEYNNGDAVSVKSGTMGESSWGNEDGQHEETRGGREHVDERW